MLRGLCSVPARSSCFPIRREPRAKRLKIKENYAKLEEKLKDKGKELLHKWEEKSKEMIGNFVDMFGKEGKLNKWFTENTMRIGRAISPTPFSSSDSPPSPSSDVAGSPPRKRGRYSATLSPPELSDDDEEL